MAEPKRADRTSPPPPPEPVSGRAVVTIEELVRAHYADVYRYAFRLAGNPAEAEDLTQQTYLIAAERLGQIREAERARGWLLTVLRNCFFRNLRRSGRELLSGDVDVESLPGEPPRTGDFDPERLQQALADLPPDYRLVLLMFYFEDRSYQEIASELSIPPGTVMSRLSRAKAHLRKALAEPAAQRPLALSAPLGR